MQFESDRGQTEVDLGDDDAAGKPLGDAERDFHRGRLACQTDTQNVRHPARLVGSLPATERVLFIQKRYKALSSYQQPWHYYPEWGEG